MEYSKQDIEQYTQQATKLRPAYDDYSDAYNAISQAIDLIDKNINRANKFIAFLDSNAQLEKFVKEKTTDPFDFKTGTRTTAVCEQYFTDAKAMMADRILAMTIVSDMMLAKGSLWGASLTLSYRHEEEF